MSVHPFPTPEHTDVLIIGAGLSGIGAAYYLQRDQPGKSFVILESRTASGGTWDLFRYPGIRSDSDLHTFGYEFKPWVHDKAIADGGDILAYLRQTAAENGIDRKIRYQRKVVSAAWSSEDARWTVQVQHTDTGETHTMVCKWLFSAAGYYRYDQGFTPRFDGIENFQGQVIHPQHWPENLNYRGKRVVVIGSGATAVTLIPSMAKEAQHVTMLQRTPTYVMSLPSRDPIANLARKLMSPAKAYAFARRKNIGLQRGIWRFCQKYPNAARRIIRYVNKVSLPK
ncbi:MAG: NAD(P)/FAD-dependent oxidoreductase, partial [Aquabacterium sp.]|nr:NAD(P)/FAD-dependent oxidoreductase [Aquabacterium sp.]